VLRLVGRPHTTPTHEAQHADVDWPGPGLA